MSNQKMNLVAERLLEQSRFNKISWAKAPGREPKYFISFPDYTVAIRNPEDRCFVLSIYDHSGAESYTLRADKGKQGPYQMLTQLFDAARGKASESDLILDDLLARLDSGETLT